MKALKAAFPYTIPIFAGRLQSLRGGFIACRAVVELAGWFHRLRGGFIACRAVVELAFVW